MHFEIHWNSNYQPHSVDVADFSSEIGDELINVSSFEFKGKKIVEHLSLIWNGFGLIVALKF